MCEARGCSKVSETRLDTASLGAQLTARLVWLVTSMRAGGVRVGIGELLAAHRALRCVDAASRPQAYFALRTTLCATKTDLEVFDTCFAACFGARVDTPQGLPPDDVATQPASRGMEDPDKQQVQTDEEPVPTVASEIEILREKDFADYTGREREVARRVMARLVRRAPQRLSRRMRPTRKRGTHAQGTQDLRRTLRASLRYGGEPVEWHWRRPSLRDRRLVLICDISGSMEPYARMLLQYLQAAVSARRRVEAFVFGTRLTRVTRELNERDPDRALSRAARSVADWSGGTRIGQALAELNRTYGRTVGRGAVVVILSDGWDRGDPALLAGELERLGRCAYRTVWLNPLKAHPDYQPLTRGMTAALPHIDHFLAGNSLASLEQLAAMLEEDVG